MTILEKIHFQIDKWRHNARKRQNRAWSGISILVMETEGARPPFRLRINYLVLAFSALLLFGLAGLALFQNFRSNSSRPIVALEERKAILESMLLSTGSRQKLLEQVELQMQDFRQISAFHQESHIDPPPLATSTADEADSGEIAASILQLSRLKKQLNFLLDQSYYNLHYLWHRTRLYHQTPRGWPLRKGKGSITSTFGSREDPFGHVKGDYHSGMDFAAAPGTPIIVTAPGTVSRSNEGESGYGQHIWVHHGNGIRTLYAHCQEILVDEGQKVERGDVIGLVGSTGRATGNHVHYEIKVGEGHSSDPFPYLLER